MLPQKTKLELDNDYRAPEAFELTERGETVQLNDDIIDEQEMCRIIGISKMTAYRYRRDGVRMPPAMPYSKKALPNGEKKRLTLRYSRRAVLTFKNSEATPQW